MIKGQIDRWLTDAESLRDSIVQAFRDVKRKDAEERAEVMQALNRICFMFDDVRDKYRTPEDCKQAERALTEAIKVKAEQQLQDQTKTDADMHRELNESSQIKKLVAIQARDIAQRVVRSRYDRTVKRGKTQAIKDGQYHALQPYLGFYELELFKLIPEKYRVIAYVNPTTEQRVRVEYSHSIEEQREYLLAQLIAKAEANANRRAQDAIRDAAEIGFVKTANDELRALKEEYGDLPAAELYAKSVQKPRTKKHRAS